MGAYGLLGWVDVDDLGQLGWLRPAGDEAFGVGGVRGVEGDGSLLLDLVCGAVVDRCRGVEPDPGVAVLQVVPVEELDTEGAGVVDPGSWNAAWR